MDLPFDGAISTYFKDKAPGDVRRAIEQSGKGDILSQRYPHAERLNKKAYEKDLAALQIQLVRWHRWVRESGQRVAIVFEGRDAAG
ncbi:MAG: polyphosphate kinase 2, partial [Pseudomonadota bacterium]